MFENIATIAPLAWVGVMSALVSGAIVGFERQIHGKPIGIRTSILICLGTYVFIVIANSVENQMTDSSRVIGQVVTGIGFLGAGVMMSRDGLVHGATSAAAIWVLAAIGIMIGSEYYLSGIKLAVLTVVILVGLNKMEDTFKAMRKGARE
ncbi:MAG: MgtC/SapB family protein [Gammaproteobacteria bacterium]